MNKTPVHVLELFAGTGGFFSIPCQKLGLSDRYVIDSVEIRDYRRAILHQHFSNHTREYTDVREFKPTRHYHIIAGGPPCSDNSRANGKGQGLNGEQSGLALDMLRIVREGRPEVVLFENPEGSRHPKGGDRISPMGIFVGCLSRLGYDVQWENLILSEDFGAPHRRERFFIIGILRKEFVTDPYSGEPKRLFDPPFWHDEVAIDIDRINTGWQVKKEGSYPRSRSPHDGIAARLDEASADFGWWAGNRFSGTSIAPQRSIKTRYEEMSMLGDGCCWVQGAAVLCYVNRYFNPPRKPVFKYTGGKTRVLKEIVKRLPACYDHYFEPFVGGGAVFFHLRPRRAFLVDANEELINTYKVIQKYPLMLIQLLEEHQSLHSPEYYYKIRSIDKQEGYLESIGMIKRAARSIYLLQACFNGLPRYNSKGQFNTPVGKPPKGSKTKILDRGKILEASEVLANVALVSGDFSEIEQSVTKNSIVYFDPPYCKEIDPETGKRKGFQDYTSNSFDTNSHLRLRKLCDRLSDRNIRFLLSNSDCPETREIYKGYDIETIMVGRTINSDKGRRGKVPEVLIRNYK
ncbi:MAG: Dam family site-specific DNA-(adenine-N6)-methyltransferase [Moorea sp. SIO4G2]|nr:Dam family site-specific DNA-(adenine-N6)-methyltransferase [Moorena sp. SIO4G2]